MTSLPITPPVPMADKTIMPVPENGLNNDPLAQNFSPMIQEEVQANPVNDGIGQPTSELHLPSASPRLQMASAMMEISPNDHDWLLELCKILNQFRTVEYV